MQLDSNLILCNQDILMYALSFLISELLIQLEVSRCVNEIGLPWEKLVGLTTDGAPAMCGHRSGLVARMRERMQEENVTGELTAYHCIIH